MHAAFVTVCARLKLHAGRGDKATDLVAVKIVDLARRGEFDVGRLTTLTLAEFGVEDDGSSRGHATESALDLLSEADHSRN
jgi:hypothetical protein